MKYNLQDISVVIPTYNRSSEIKKTLECINPVDIKEIIIIDQSKISNEAENIKKICVNFHRAGFPINYYHFDFASTAMARNKGVELSNDKSKIICFIDDDVSIQNNYFKVIIDKFNTYPEIWGVSAYIPEKPSKLTYFIDQTIRRIFLLNKYEKNKCNVNCPYNNTYPPSLNKDIFAQWYPGVNMSYKKEIFEKNSFDKCLGGYSLAEDMEFSYSLFLQNPRALLLTPDTLVEHYLSKTERADIKKMSYINQVDHFYFYWKYKYSFSKLKHYWCLFGILLLRTLNLINFRRESFLKWYYFISSSIYCFSHKKIIKGGGVREWLR